MPASDVLMRVVAASGPLIGESLTTFSVPVEVDLLRKDFTAGQLCELDSFSFGAGVSAAGGNDKVVETTPKPGEASRTPFGGSAPVKRNDRGDPVDLLPFRCQRRVDSMSTPLMKAISQCETLESLSIVKRRATGTTSGNSGDCYFRLDFSKVLITGLDWASGGFRPMENITFIYRKVMIRYRPQKEDGSLDAVIQMEWQLQAIGNAGRT